ncbi:MAG: hypothetical protein SFW67_08875 [Myxococcaceae bacterium]|nr:hypothetical protein [Myxococcaceae bacterium]
MATLRERLVGQRYVVSPSIWAEVRKSCRDELKILYGGGPFDDATWTKLDTFGRREVFEASKLNPAMRDLFRVHGPGLRLEGARGGELLVAFFLRPRAASLRRRLEDTLRQARP